MIRISKSEEHNRLQCNCGYISRRTGYTDMVDHVTFNHCCSVEPARIRPELQNVWSGKTKAASVRLTDKKWICEEE